MADVLPPHSAEAEEAVLGSLMIDPLSVPRIAALLRAEDFYLVKNGWIYEHLVKLGISADILTISAALAADRLLDEVGGEAYLAQVTAQVPTALNVEHYAKIVADFATRRRMITAAQEIARMGYDLSTPVSSGFAKAGTALTRVMTGRDDPRVKNLEGHFDGYVEWLGQREETFYPFGIHDLDVLMDGGAIPSEFVAIGSAPGFGKTSLACQMAYVNLKRGRRVIYFSFEVNARDIISRIISRSLFDKGVKIPYSAAVKRKLSGDMLERWNTEVADFTAKYGKNLVIADPSSMTPMQMESLCITEGLKAPLDIVIVDQLHHMRDDERAKDVRSKYGNVSSGLRRIPKEMKNATDKEPSMIVLSYISRDGYDKPDLGSWKETGQIEFDIGVGILLYGEPSNDKVINIKVAKSRNGATGEVTVSYAREYCLMK